MKSIISILGVILIIIGISSFAYRGFTYTSREEVAKIGNLQVTADTTKTVYLSPIFGGLSIAAGIILVFIGRRNGR